MNTRRNAWTALLLLVPAPTFGVVMAMYVIPGPVGQVIYALSKMWLLAFPLIWLRLVDRGRFSWSPPRHGGFGAAVLIGVVTVLAIAGAYALVGDAWIDPAEVRAAAERNGIAKKSTYLGLAIYLCLINALLEEYVWRWFVFRKCEQLMPTRAAVVVAGLLFTVHHVFALRAQFSWSATLLSSLGVFIGGTMWSWLYGRYRSIWPGYVAHLFADVVIFVIGWRLIFG